MGGKIIYDLQRSDRNTNLEISSSSKASNKSASSSSDEECIVANANCYVGVDNHAAVHAKLGRNCRRRHRCEYFAPVWGSLNSVRTVPNVHKFISSALSVGLMKTK